jgi:hypothetical protein
VELFLNLAGALVAIGLIGLWIRVTPATGAGSKRTTQLVALALLILILFPVISVTDDLIAVQNPAETDSLQRRNLEVSNLHAAILSAAIPLAAFRLPPPVVLAPARPQALPIPLPIAPALTTIENRPPPTA